MGKRRNLWQNREEEIMEFKSNFYVDTQELLEKKKLYQKKAPYDKNVVVSNVPAEVFEDPDYLKQMKKIATMRNLRYSLNKKARTVSIVGDREGVGHLKNYLKSVTKGEVATGKKKQ